MARNYNNFKTYTLSYQFVLLIYKLSSKFPEEEKQNITSQLRRATVSIPLNIAEGSAKAGEREFIYFLNIAYASAKEVEVLLHICLDLQYLKESEYKTTTQLLDEINAKLFLFIRSLEEKIPGNRYKFFRKFEQQSTT